MTINDTIRHADMEFNSGQDPTKTILEALKLFAGWRQCRGCELWHADPNIIRCRCGERM